MNYKILIEVEAKQELRDAAEWYENHRKGLGERFLDKFLNVIDYLEIHPDAFPKIEGEYRQVVMKTFPFVVVYKTDGDKVRIIAVFHTSRNPKKKIR